jgi:hypothetical protein
MTPLPNTHLIHAPPRVIVCAGEDQAELLAAAVLHLPSIRDAWSFRCYRFWYADDILIAWTGIGTGCLEPLVFELCAAGHPEKIALIGTAGLPQGSSLVLGECRPVTSAFARGNAINAVGVDPSQSLRPNTSEAFNAECVAASTDFYYASLPEWWTPGIDLVDMEVAQFYHLCDRFSRLARIRTQYLAFKGAANRIGCPGEQLQHSAGVIADCLRQAALWVSA